MYVYVYIRVGSGYIGGQSLSYFHGTRTLKLMRFKYRKVHVQKVLGIMKIKKLVKIKMCQIFPKNISDINFKIHLNFFQKLFTTHTEKFGKQNVLRMTKQNNLWQDVLQVFL